MGHQGIGLGTGEIGIDDQQIVPGIVADAAGQIETFGSLLDSGIDEIELDVFGVYGGENCIEQIPHSGLGLGHNVGQNRMHHRTDERFAVAVISRSENNISGNRVPNNRPFLVGKFFQFVKDLGTVTAAVVFGTVIAESRDADGTGNFEQVNQQLSVYGDNSIYFWRFGQQIIGVESVHGDFEMG